MVASASARRWRGERAPGAAISSPRTLPRATRSPAPARYGPRLQVPRCAGRTPDPCGPRGPARPGSCRASARVMNDPTVRRPRRQRTSNFGRACDNYWKTRTLNECRRNPFAGSDRSLITQPHHRKDPRPRTGPAGRRCRARRLPDDRSRVPERAAGYGLFAARARTWPCGSPAGRGREGEGRCLGEKLPPGPRAAGSRPDRRVERADVGAEVAGFVAVEPQQRRVVQRRGRADQPARAGRARRALAAERGNRHVHRRRAHAAECDAGTGLVRSPAAVRRQFDPVPRAVAVPLADPAVQCVHARARKRCGPRYGESMRRRPGLPAQGGVASRRAPCRRFPHSRTSRSRDGELARSDRGATMSPSDFRISTGVRLSARMRTPTVTAAGSMPRRTAGRRQHPGCGWRKPSKAGDSGCTALM